MEHWYFEPVFIYDNKNKSIDIFSVFVDLLLEWTYQIKFYKQILALSL